MNIPIVETLATLNFLLTARQATLPVVTHFAQTDSTIIARKVLFKPNKTPLKPQSGGSGRKDIASGVGGGIERNPKTLTKTTLGQLAEELSARTPRYVPPSRRGAPARTQGGGSRAIDENPLLKNLVASFPQPNLSQLIAQVKKEENEYRGSGRLETTAPKTA